MTAADITGAIDAAASALGPQLAQAIAAPAVKRGARDLLTSPEVREGVDAVAWRVGAIVGGCVLAAIVFGHLAGKAVSR